MAEEITLKKSESGEETQLFRLFILKSDDYRSVEVVEVEGIDFVDVLRRLENGESIFIPPKRRHRTEQVRTKRTASAKGQSPWHFSSS